MHYILKPGTTIKTLALELEEKKFIKHPYYLVILAVATKGATKIQAGEYEFSGGIKPYGLLKKIIDGDVVQHHITLVEGWTFSQIMQCLEHTPYLKHQLANLSNEKIRDILKIPYKSLEGLFYPDTYRYTYGMSDKQILLKAYAIMQQKLNQAWQNRDYDLPYDSAYKALIVASMIEKETALDSEKPLIAGVIVRRIQKRMYLQIDPTVIFGLGAKYNGKLTSADLKYKTPYNTYMHKGLPPTPIAIPGDASILAATKPQITDALYFVAKGDGSHIFSITLKAHDKAIIKYLINPSAKNQKTQKVKP